MASNAIQRPFQIRQPIGSPGTLCARTESDAEPEWSAKIMKMEGQESDWAVTMVRILPSTVTPTGLEGGRIKVGGTLCA